MGFAALRLTGGHPTHSTRPPDNGGIAHGPERALFSEPRGLRPVQQQDGPGAHQVIVNSLHGARLPSSWYASLVKVERVHLVSRRAPLRVPARR